MRILFKFITFILFLGILLSVGSKIVKAQIVDPHPACPPSTPACWPTRTVNQWSCTDCEEKWVCSGNTMIQCLLDPYLYPLDSSCPAQGTTGPCVYVCWDMSGAGCHIWASNLLCDQVPPACGLNVAVFDCEFDMRSGCNLDWTLQSFGCCGPGSGGATPTPGGGAPIPSCTVSFSPGNLNVAAGDTATLTANVSSQNGSVDNVIFYSLNPGVATVSNPWVNPAYSTTVTGIIPGNTGITVDVYMNGVVTCGGPAPIKNVIVTNAGPWWQVIDSDVITNGDVRSPIPGTCVVPCDNAFVVDKFPDSPGVPFYGLNYDFNSGVGQGTVSDKGWHANANYSAITEYKYAFYERLIPGDTIRNPIAGSTIGVGLLTSGAGSVSPDGYKWFFKDGDVTLNRQGLTSNKIILFVDGNLTIDGEINLDDGMGFFMAIVSGNITVDPIINVAGPELEGIFVTDQTFITAADDDQLHIRGMVSAYNANSSGPIIMGRNLADNTRTPSEIFEYAPDLLFNYPPSLTLKRTRWKEVTP